MLDPILNLIFPLDCVLCGQRVLEWRSGALCPECEAGLRIPEPPLCAQCGAPGPAENVCCHHCRSHPTRFDLARFALQFDEALRDAIHHFKYNDRVSLARPFGRCLRACFQQNPFAAKVAVPVPLHKKRERRRGYNQAALLARQLGIEVRSDLIRRVRATGTQTGLTRRQRDSNVRNAFACVRPFTGRVLIVDDVMTTGATIREVARVLRKNEASRVEVLTLTRVVKSDQPETGAVRDARVSMTQ